MKRLLKRQHVKLIMLIMMLLTMLVGCTSNKDIVEETKTESFNVSIIDSTGETITLSSEPQRIVSLAPGITEILYYLGIEDKIVGRTDYCNFPENIKEVPSVGDSNNFNLEAIIALEPDLVIGATYIPQDTMDKLREMGIKLAFLNEQESFEGTFAAIDKVGKLVNREAEATDIVVGMQNKIDDTVEAVEALGKTEKPKVYYMVGYGQQDFTAGGDTFIGEIINLAGGDNIAQNIQGWAISREQILESQPDIIIIPNDTVTLEELQQTEFYKDLDAVKSGKVYEINGDIISRQGPRIVDALVDIAKIINPELV